MHISNLTHKQKIEVLSAWNQSELRYKKMNKYRKKDIGIIIRNIILIIITGALGYYLGSLK